MVRSTLAYALVYIIYTEQICSNTIFIDHRIISLGKQVNIFQAPGQRDIKGRVASPAAESDTTRCRRCMHASLSRNFYRVLLSARLRRFMDAIARIK